MLIIPNTTITIKKLNQWTQREYIFSDALEAYIEPLSDSLKLMYDENPAWNFYRIFCDQLDVAVWDLIVSDTHWNLKVLWVKPYNSPIESHNQITVRDVYE